MISNRTSADPHITVILPAYNEAAGIHLTLADVASHLQTLIPDWDVVVIDDGSIDHTSKVVRELPDDLRTTLVRFSRNFGKENAITAGLEYARGDVVVCMDADGQHSLELLGEMLAKWREGYDMVYAVRASRGDESHFKRWGTRFFYKILSFGGEVDIPSDAGDFRLMDRKVVDALRSLPERNRFMKGIYSWVGYKSISIPYTPKQRLYGESAYSKMRLMQLAWTGIMSFSVAPLRLASVVGSVLALIAFIYGIVVVVDKVFFHESAPGWPTLIACLMFFSGVQLLFIGILGEYLAHVYNEVKNRPNYIVAEVVSARDTHRQDHS